MPRIKPVLPGQSRSGSCTRSKTCARLAGHKGAHRTTLAATAKPSIKVGQPTIMSRIDALLAQIEALRAEAAPRKAGTSIATEGGVEVLSADRYTVQPDRPARKARRPKVRTLPAAEAEGRDVQTIRGKSSRRRTHYVSGKPSARLA